jgi:HSP90 family molecular chaperone
MLLLLLQAFSDPSRAAMMRGQRTLEINPNHPLITGLKNKVSSAGFRVQMVVYDSQNRHESERCQ